MCNEAEAREFSPLARKLASRYPKICTLSTRMRGLECVGLGMRKLERLSVPKPRTRPRPICSGFRTHARSVRHALRARIWLLSQRVSRHFKSPAFCFRAFLCYTPPARLVQASGPVATHRKLSFQCIKVEQGFLKPSVRRPLTNRESGFRARP